MESGFDAHGHDRLNIARGEGGDAVTSSRAASRVTLASGVVTFTNASGEARSVPSPSGTLRSMAPAAEGITRSLAGAVVHGANAHGGGALRTALAGSSDLTFVETRDRITVREERAQESTSPAAKDGARREHTRATRERVYVRDGDSWVLTEIRSAVSVPGQGTSVTQRLTFSSVRHHENAERDGERSRLRQGQAPSYPVPSLPRHGARGKERGLSGNSRSVATGSGISRTDYPPICDDGTTAERALDGGVGSRNIIFQHGFGSGGCTWTRMEARMWSDGTARALRRYSTPPLEHLDTQMQEMLGKAHAQAAPGARYLVIGHSQGGLIARKAAQTDPELISGAMTIDSPHEGALINTIGREIVGYVMSLPFIFIGCVDLSTEWCALAADIAGNIVRPAVDETISSAAPVTEDHRLFSPWLAALNSPYETFPRASIVSHTPPRWAICRLVGEQMGGDPDWYDGYHWQSGCAEVSDYVLLVAIGMLLEHGIGGDFNNGGWQTFMLWGALQLVDRGWNYMTSGLSEDGDGLVDAGSQRYPVGVPGTFATPSYDIPSDNTVDGVVIGGDSHVGVTRSAETYLRITRAIRERF